MHENIPRLDKYSQVGGYQPLPLVGGEQQADKYQTVQQPEKSAQKVPVARDADGVPEPGQPNPGGEVAAVILGRPDTVFGHR